MTAAEPAVTRDLFLDGAVEVFQPKDGGHRAGLDAVLLAASVSKSAIGHLVDFGSGCGIAGMAVAHRCPGVSSTLVEIDPELSRMTERSLALEGNQGFAARCRAVCLDVSAPVRLWREEGIPDQSADIVIANPPYNQSDHRPSPNPDRAFAHQANAATFADWTAAANRVLKAKGRLHLIVRPQSLQEILTSMEARFGQVRILPLHPRAQDPASRLIIMAQKGSRTALSVLPSMALHGADGAFLPNIEDVLRGRLGLGQPY